MNKTLTKLNNMPLEFLYDFYWLKMYPKGLSFKLKNGRIAGVSKDMQFSSF